MAASEETATKSATALNEEEPSDTQFPQVRGRSKSPPWRKLLVYDCENQAVKVKSEKKIDKQIGKKVELPPKRQLVTIFVDPETESKPTIDSRGKDGQSNVILATLYLNRLGAYHRVLRFLGLLSTLYVVNAAPWSETSSQIIGGIGGQKPGNTVE